MQRLLADLEHRAQCRLVFLHVLTSNTAACSFYESVGFTRCSRLADYYDLPGSKQQSIQRLVKIKVFNFLPLSFRKL